jgi:hypothetical protein
LTNIAGPCLISIVVAGRIAAERFFGSLTIAHDKGKPAARQGRKAVSLPVAEDCLVAEWAIGESRAFSTGSGRNRVRASPFRVVVGSSKALRHT